MGTIQEELQAKVLPVFKVPDEWKQGDEGASAPGYSVTYAPPASAQATVPMNYSERLHAAVAAEPGKTSGYYAKVTQDQVPRGSVEALLRQLSQRGYLAREQKPEGFVYTITDKPYVAGGAYQRKLDAIQKASKARTTKRVVKTKAKTPAEAPSAPQETPKQAQAPGSAPMDIVRSLSVYDAHAVWRILDNMFGRK